MSEKACGTWFCTQLFDIKRFIFGGAWHTSMSLVVSKSTSHYNQYVAEDFFSPEREHPRLFNNLRYPPEIERDV